MSQNILSSLPSWIQFFDTLESTNNYATQLIHEGMAKHGDVIWTKHQTKGKGQRGKGWVDSPDNLKFSIIVAHEKVFSHSFLLSFLVATLLQKYLTIILSAENKVNIKWPNDIYINDKKACGILIENIYHGGEWKFSVIGIGLNVHQKSFPNSLKNATSLCIESPDNSFNFMEIITDLRSGILNELRKTNGLAEANILKEYNRQLYRKGQSVNFRNKKNNQEFQAKIIGVTETGALALFNAAGLQEYEFGSLEWLL